MEIRGIRGRDKTDGGRHHSRQNKGRDKEENRNRRRGNDDDDDDDDDDSDDNSDNEDEDNDGDENGLGDGERERPWQSVGIADAGRGHAAPTRYSDRSCSSGKCRLYCFQMFLIWLFSLISFVLSYLVL